MAFGVSCECERGHQVAFNEVAVRHNSTNPSSDVQRSHLFGCLSACLFWLLVEERCYVVSRILIMACHGEIKVELIYFL